MYPTREAVQLLLDGSLVSARMQHHGIRIDLEWLHKARRDARKVVDDLGVTLRQDAVWEAWKGRFHNDANLDSPRQLSNVIFDVLGHPCPGRTKPSATHPEGLPRADREAFSGLDLPFLKAYFRRKQHQKLLETYLKGIEEETTGGFVHPDFKFHSVKSFRSSSASPNLHNQMNRNSELSPILRGCYVAREGHRLVEVDYGALEFRVVASVWDDANMQAYADDPSKDVHRDCAALVFSCRPEEVSKAMRAEAKNKFVFPLVYGSYYLSCARDLWGVVAGGGLTLKDGKTLLSDYLAGVGLGRPGRLIPGRDPAKGTYEEYVKRCEGRFYEWFPDYKRNAEVFWEDYQEKGWFRIATGFVCRGDYSRNFVLNAPSQGPGFHCLLWSLIRLDREVRERGVKALLVGQIHDCILADVPDGEVQEFLDLIERVMTKDVRAHWDWIKTNLEVEVDCTPVGGRWSEKAPWERKEGKWQPKARK